MLSGLLEYEKQLLDFINNDSIKKIIDDGKQEEYIGKVSFRIPILAGYNSGHYDCGFWTIADFGHDNSGYTMDLIAASSVTERSFDNGSNNYVDSGIRKWLNNEFYHGFSESIRAKMDTMEVKTNTTEGLIITNDKIKILSCKEINLDDSDFCLPYIMNGLSVPFQQVFTVSDEGTPYPVFDKSHYKISRPKEAKVEADEEGKFKITHEGFYGFFNWLRTAETRYSNFTWIISSSGNIRYRSDTSCTHGIVPVIRLKNI